MKITAIKQQVKRSDRYSIFVDDKYAFSLSESELVSTGIHNGVELSRSELKNYKKLSQIDKVYGLVLNLIARRPRSTKEINDYLKRKQLDEEESGIILNKLHNSRLLNDWDFAQRWVQNRRELKNSSNRKIRLELRVKGINPEIIDEVLADSVDSERAALIELVARKRRQVKYQDNNKLIQYLARQGFSYEDIKQAVSDVN